MAIKWTKTALGPIDEIAGFIAKDNPTRASSFVLELQDAVTKLQPHPGMAELAGSRAHVSWSCTKTTSPFTARVAMMSKSCDCITPPEVDDELRQFQKKWLRVLPVVRGAARAHKAPLPGAVSQRFETTAVGSAA